MALSGPRLAVTNRTAESWWLFLAHVWPQQIVLAGLCGSFWPRLGHTKSYFRVLPVVSFDVPFFGWLVFSGFTTNYWSYQLFSIAILE